MVAVVFGKALKLVGDRGEGILRANTGLDESLVEIWLPANRVVNQRRGLISFGKAGRGGELHDVVQR